MYLWVWLIFKHWLDFFLSSLSSFPTPAVLGIEPMAVCVLGKYSTPEPMISYLL